jgi:hypothetical protein
MVTFSKDQGWSFIPGPDQIVEPAWSVDMREEVARIPAAEFASGVLKIPNVQLVHGNEPTWWDWRVVWNLDLSFVNLDMIIEGDNKDTWGGSNIECSCSEHSFISFWKDLMQISRQIYLHAPDCRMYTISSFKKEMTNLV